MNIKSVTSGGAKVPLNLDQQSSGQASRQEREPSPQVTQPSNLREPFESARVARAMPAAAEVQPRMPHNHSFEFNASSPNFQFSGHYRGSSQLTIETDAEHCRLTIGPSGQNVDHQSVGNRSTRLGTAPLEPSQQAAGAEAGDQYEPYPLGGLDIFGLADEYDLFLGDLEIPSVIAAEADLLGSPVAVAQAPASTSATAGLKEDAPEGQTIYFQEIAQLVERASPGHVTDALQAIRVKWDELQGTLKRCYPEPDTQTKSGRKKQRRYEPTDGVHRTERQKKQWKAEQRRIRNRESAAQSRQVVKDKLETLEAVVPRLNELQRYMNHIESFYPRR